MKKINPVLLVMCPCAALPATQFHPTLTASPAALRPQAVNYVDRFLSLRPVPRTQIQLVGVAAMWVAAKYEEIYAPSAADFVFITDSSYSREALVAAESELLSALGWQLTVPTAKTFLRRFLQVRTSARHGAVMPANGGVASHAVR